MSDGTPLAVLEAAVREPWRLRVGASVHACALTLAVNTWAPMRDALRAYAHMPGGDGDLARAALAAIDQALAETGARP